MSRAGEILGPPGYMPEQASGVVTNIGPAVDVYALGPVLDECLTGCPRDGGARGAGPVGARPRLPPRRRVREREADGRVTLPAARESGEAVLRAHAEVAKSGDVRENRVKWPGGRDGRNDPLARYDSATGRVDPSART